MRAAAWSKATDEQRARHRQGCREAGKERRMQNFVRDVFAKAQEVGVDGGDYLAVWGLILKNNKFPPCDGDKKKMIELLQRRQGPVEVYREIFNEARCRGVTT